MSVLAIYLIVTTGVHWFRFAWFWAGENNHPFWLISCVTTRTRKRGLGKKKRQEGSVLDPFFGRKQ
jgi:hypothetical protein